PPSVRAASSETIKAFFILQGATTRECSIRPHRLTVMGRALASIAFVIASAGAAGRQKCSRARVLRPFPSKNPWLPRGNRGRDTLFYAVCAKEQPTFYLNFPRCAATDAVRRVPGLRRRGTAVYTGRGGATATQH